MTSAYEPHELEAMGLTIGEDVQVDRGARFFGAEHITIGSHVRIDAFCTISAREPVVIGDHVHLAIGVSLFGAEGGIVLEDFVGLSARATLFSATDDYSSGHLTNPTVPRQYKRIQAGPILCQRHSIIGAGSVIMPGVTIGTGAAVGAVSFVNKSIPAYMVVSGNPVRKVGMRDRERLLALEAEFIQTKGSHDG